MTVDHRYIDDSSAAYWLRAFYRGEWAAIAEAVGYNSGPSCQMAAMRYSILHRLPWPPDEDGEAAVANDRRYRCVYCEAGMVDELPAKCPGCGCSLTIEVDGSTKITDLSRAMNDNGFDLRVDFQPKDLTGVGDGE